MSHVEPGVAIVVDVPLHVFPTIASLAAGPALVTLRLAEPAPMPGTVAVTVQLPGAPVTVTTVDVVLDPALIVELVGETVQMPALSTLQVAFCEFWLVAGAPLASFNVAVAVVDCALPAANSFRSSATPTWLGAPAVANDTFTKQPCRIAVDADSWSEPVADVGCVNANVATPLLVVFVDGAPAAPPSRLPTVPACDRVMLRPLSVVTVRPFASCTDTVIVEVCVEPATMLAGDALHPSFAGAPTGADAGTVIRQKMP